MKKTIKFFLLLHLARDQFRYYIKVSYYMIDYVRCLF